MRIKFYKIEADPFVKCIESCYEDCENNQLWKILFVKSKIEIK